jgi:Uma2 family endonuclease
MGTEISKRLFTVEDYQRMVEAGILSEDDRVELIRGEVVAMSPVGPAHNGAIIRALNALVPLVSRHALVSAQGAVRLGKYDEPQPDIVLLRPKADCYTTQHPGPTDILLIIEIADSSLEYDRKMKAGLYAETGILEYWIADIPNDCVWAYSDPHNNTYRTIRRFRRGESLTPHLLAECRIAVDILLP